ncbi:MAG: hypothetical protein AB7G76_03215 [Steroidobacteraceae bacterium]
MTTIDTLSRARRNLTTIALRAAGELAGTARAGWAVLEAAGRDAGAVMTDTATQLRHPRNARAATAPARKKAAGTRKRRPAAQARVAPL